MPRTPANVPITAGSGTNVDTIQTNPGSDHRQIFVLGDPDTEASLSAISPAGQLSVRDDLMEDVLRNLRAIRRGLEMLLDQEIPDED